MIKRAAKWLAGRMMRLIPERLLGRILPSKFRFDPAHTPPPPAAPSTRIRLFIAPTNYAGQGWEWARAVERHIPGAGAVNMVCRVDSDFQHPADNVVDLGFYAASSRWQQTQSRAIANDFTHVIIEAEKQPFGAVLDETVAGQIRYLREHGVRVAMLCHGSDIRLPSRHRANNPDSPFWDSPAVVASTLERTARHNRSLLDSLGLPVFVSTPDLLFDVPYATWLPVVVDIERWSSVDSPLLRDRPVVAHAPSYGFVKGSELIDPIVQALDDEGLIEYRRIEKVPYERMPEVYRSADIVLDQFRLGDYGVAACEAMAAGRVVVGHVSEHSRDVVRTETGHELPVVQAMINDLDRVLRMLIGDRERSRAIASDGRLFAEAVHDGRRSSSVLSGFLT